jgi:hypothetical protein
MAPPNMMKERSRVTPRHYVYVRPHIGTGPVLELGLIFRPVLELGLRCPHTGTVPLRGAHCWNWAPRSGTANLTPNISATLNCPVPIWGRPRPGSSKGRKIGPSSSTGPVPIRGPTYTSLLQYKFHTNTEKIYVATVKNILALPFAYSIVTKKNFPRQLRERELHPHGSTIQCHSFKCVYHLSSQKTFPTTIPHVHMVVQIKYAAQITLQILTQPYEVT